MITLYDSEAARRTIGRQVLRKPLCRRQKRTAYRREVSVTYENCGHQFVQGRSGALVKDRVRYDAAERARGVIASRPANHAQAIAYMRSGNIPATIVMPVTYTRS